MRSTKANIGSLSSMASKVRQEKKNSASAKPKAPLARARDTKKPFKSADKVEDSSSDSDSSSDGADGSDSDGDLDAARAKFLASKAAKQSKPVEAKAKVNGAGLIATPAKPAADTSTPTSAQKPANESGSESESESESETSDSGSSSSAAKPVAAQNKSSGSKAKRDSSRESTTSSDSSSDGETASKPNKNVNSKNLASEESEESDSSSDEDSGAQVNAKDAAQVSAVNAEDSSSEESDSGSESDDEGDGGKMAVARANGQDKDSTSQTSRTQWLNNSDFMLRKASSNNPGKEVADFFSNANLEGKQVWYFTAPASLPITVLKDMEIDLSKATNGGPLLTHDGDNYGLDIESYATNTQIQLLIPSSGGDKYTSLNHGIDSTVHLRRMAKFGPGGEVHATATDNYVPVLKPIREQPEGLRVRYTPIGVPSPTVVSAAPTKTAPANAPGSQAKTKVRAQSSSSESDSESDSDVEMTTPPPSTTPTTRKKPAKSGMSNGDRKRKHSGEEDQMTKRLKAQKTPDVPSTKKHTTAQAPNAAANANATPSKKSSTKSKGKKEQAKKEKTPKPTAATPTAAKQTPIPLPSYPGMKR